jgi:hypothetical protein
LERNVPEANGALERRLRKLRMDVQGLVAEQLSASARAEAKTAPRCVAPTDP